MDTRVEIKVGDVVRLKSGGPLMTIDEHSNKVNGHHEKFTCVWFVDNKRESGLFAPQSITLVDTPVD
jgi:uncharacterized protein YodC (DUF2158 family)